MAESLPPTGHRYETRRNSRKRSLEVEETKDEEAKDAPQEKSEEGSRDCAICLQTWVHPARLPCGHTFCFLCLKGMVHSTAKCALCRRPISRNYLETPDLLEIPTPSTAAPGEENSYQWFYEGRHGWWEYDPRANAYLEEAYTGGESKVELLIAGYVYIVDLQGMMQYRKTDPGRRRCVKRDKIGTASIGVAGIRPVVLQAMRSRSTNRSQSPESTLSDTFRNLSMNDEVDRSNSTTRSQSPESRFLDAFRNLSMNDEGGFYEDNVSYEESGDDGNLDDDDDDDESYD